MTKKGNQIVKNRKLLLGGLSLLALLTLSGCIGRDTDGNPVGLIWDWLGAPMSKAITFFAENQGLGFGVAIIIVTIIVRFIILPLGIYQSWKATYQSEKMRYLKPILEPIQERMKNAETREEQMAAQQELMNTHREYGVSMFGGIGCLPILIQMPFFSAIFFATQYTEGIAKASFLGISLGKQSLILVAVAGILYFIQSLVMQIGVDEAQKQQMKSMMLINPMMIVIFSLNSPAGVTLYWIVGGLFGILQQLIITFMLKPKIKKMIDKELESKPLKPIRASKPVKDVTPTTDSAIITKKKKRNAGKQRSR